MTISSITSHHLKRGQQCYLVNLGASHLDLEKFNSLLDQLATESELGMDTEWKPVFRGRPKQTLLQLSGSKLTLLIQIGRARRLTRKLCQILESADITKYGCGIMEDANLLSRRFKINIGGLVDLEPLADTHNVPRKLCGHTKQGEPRYGLRGLVTLYNHVMKTDLPKKERSITMSDWSQIKLTDEQIQYAIFDAVMSYEIGHKLSSQK